jgi:hypothetical protein
MHMRRGAGPGQKRKMALGIAAVAIFIIVAAGAIGVILALGSTHPKPPPSAPNAEAAQRRFLDACTRQWGAKELRCRCFLTAAGPNIQPDDYDDFSAMMDAYVAGNTARQETVIAQAVTRRGAPAGARLTAAFRSVVRNCPQ